MTAPPRYNRFQRKGRSFHSPVAAGPASANEEGDVELGALLQRRAPSWTNDDENSDCAAASESEVAPSARKYRPHRLVKGSKTKSFSAPGTSHVTVLTHRPRLRPRRHRFQSRSLARFSFLVRMTLMTLGVLQCVTYLCGFLEAIMPDSMDLISGPFKDSFVPHELPDRQWRYDLDQLTADVRPFMCHSHNDYWRREPLYQAIHAGCTGVEADLWLLNDQLFVAHTPSGIRRNRTLETLYLDPLMELLDQKNMFPDFLDQTAIDSDSRVGLFDAKPRQSLVLLIDFKNKPEEVWQRLNDLLEPFREKKYMTYVHRTVVVHGPLTIVVSGHAPWGSVVANSTYRDIFYDAPLDTLDVIPTNLPLGESTLDEFDGDGNQTDSTQPISNDTPIEAIAYSPLNSFYASASFKRTIGYPFHSSLSQAQLQKIRTQIRTAHSMGLKVRYWGIPAWPIGVRNYLWRVLVREGVDYLSVDDIDDVRSKDWGPRKGGWGKKWWR